MDVQSLKPFLEELARLGGAVTLKYFRRPIDIERKKDDSPVTAADRETEAAIVKRIREKFPDHGVLAEESGTDHADAEWVWVIDPIDGTKSFITGVPLYTTLVGLLHRGEPVLGCIYQPVLDQMCIGDNRETTLNGNPVRVRAARDLSECTLLTSDWLEPAALHGEDGWKRLCQSVRLARTWGDGYGYLLLATGYADIMADGALSPWDILPVLPVVRGAGCAVSDWKGSKALPLTSAVAANPRIHRSALDVLLS